MLIASRVRDCTRPGSARLLEVVTSRRRAVGSGAGRCENGLLVVGDVQPLDEVLSDGAVLLQAVVGAADPCAEGGIGVLELRAEDENHMVLVLVIPEDDLDAFDLAGHGLHELHEVVVGDDAARCLAPLTRADLVGGTCVMDCGDLLHLATSVVKGPEGHPIGLRQRIPFDTACQIFYGLYF